MNEEAMTPDKEQVVEPLSAEERPLTGSEYAANLRSMLAAAELGPVDWAGPIEDVAEFLSGTQQRTDEHGDAGGAGWAVQSRDAELVVAFTGTGPHASAYAEVIAYLLNGAERIAHDLATLDAARTASVPPASQDTLSADLRRIAEDGNHTHDWNTANPDHFDLHCGPCIADRALAGTHERPANHRPLGDAARTASVTGLDRERLATAITDAYDNPEYEEGWFDKGDIPRPAVMAEQIAASYDRLNSAPSIEQEPGEVEDARQTAVAQSLADAGLTSAGRRRAFLSALKGRGYTVAPRREQEPGETLRNATDLVLAAIKTENPTYRTPELDAIRAALREQEPGETLRAAAQQAARVLEDFNTGPSIMARVALRRALAANPQETER